MYKQFLLVTMLSKNVALSVTFELLPMSDMQHASGTISEIYTDNGVSLLRHHEAACGTHRQISYSVKNILDMVEKVVNLAI